MPDVTVKRVEDFEAIFGGGFRRARAGLGVSSFGLAVDGPAAELRPLPGARPDPRRSGGGLHRPLGPGHPRVGGEEYELEPGVVRAGRRDREAQARHRRRAGAHHRDGRHAGQGLRAAGVHPGGPSRPRWTRSSPRRHPPSSGHQAARFGAEGEARSDLRGRCGRDSWRSRLPGRPRRRRSAGVVAITRSSSPEMTAPGTPESLSRTRSAADATSSASRDQRGRQLAAPGRSRPPPVRRAASRPAQPIATSA